MQTRQIERVKSQDVGATDLETQHAKRRLNLHTTSGFESPGRHDLSALKPDKASTAADDERRANQPKVVEHRLADGTIVRVPGLSDAQHLEIARVFARQSPERRGFLERAATRLAAAVYADVQAQPAAASRPVSATVSAAYSATQEAAVLGAGSDAQIQAQRDSYFAGIGAVEKELQTYFTEVKERQQVAAEARTDQAELVEMLSSWPDDGSSESFTYREIKVSDDGELVVTEKTVQLTKEQALGLLQSLELQGSTIGEITAMDGFKLQKMTQDYQEGMTILSNILKQQDETLRGTIQNVKA
jgi:hypothetical protein